MHLGRPNHMNIASTNVSAVARLFSSAVVGEMAEYGRSSTFNRLARQIDMDEAMAGRTTVRDLYASAYTTLRRSENRHEYVYKNAIVEKILLGTHSLNTASALMEFRVGRSKADLVMLNGTAAAFEIKSERDSLFRMKAQVEDYLKVFATVNVIVAENHLTDAEKCVPDEVGLLVLTDRYTISTIRKAENRPERVSCAAVFDALSTSEACDLLEWLGADVPDVPNTIRRKAIEGLIEDFRPEQVHRAMVAVLKKRRNLSSLEQLLDQIPSALFSAAIRMRITRERQRNLLCALSTPMEGALAW